jgi:hypothetical protein
MERIHMNPVTVDIAPEARGNSTPTHIETYMSANIRPVQWTCYSSLSTPPLYAPADEDR